MFGNFKKVWNWKDCNRLGDWPNEQVCFGWRERSTVRKLTSFIKDQHELEQRPFRYHMLSMPAEVPERRDKQTDNSQVDMVVFLTLEKTKSRVVIQAQLQVLIEYSPCMRLMLHVGGVWVETDPAVNDNRPGNKLSGKEGKSVHKDAVRIETTGAPRVQVKEPQGTVLLATFLLHWGH